MELRDKRLLVTGGAGLIGPVLVERLLPENEVIVADDLSKGRRDRVPEGARFHEADVADPGDVAAVLDGSVDAVFHLAALSDAAYPDKREQYERNTAMTHTLIERMAEVGVSKFVFTSSSAVYGEAPRPTPEDYAPLEPISIYGAAKLADEALLSTYVHSQSFQVWTLRFANVVGPGQRDNVVPDFVEKLLADPTTLEILGDGRQEKSYVHVTDCADGICHVVEHADDPRNTYNLGTRTTISVDRIADVVADELGVDPRREYTGGDRGWVGDVPKMRLSIEKAAALGWEPAMSSEEAIERAAAEMHAELGGE